MDISIARVEIDGSWLWVDGHFYGGWELVEVYFVWLRMFLDIFYGLTGVSEGILWVVGVK